MMYPQKIIMLLLIILCSHILQAHNIMIVYFSSILLWDCKIYVQNLGLDIKFESTSGESFVADQLGS
jgi:hypothetical protein